MEYFFIACSVASLAALIGWILDKTSTHPHRKLAAVVTLFAVLTIGFWLWVYFWPTNVLHVRIDERTDFSGAYKNGSEILDIVVGTFEIDTLTWTAKVKLPPLKEPPTTIHLYPIDRRSRGEPTIENKTADSFTVSISDSDLAGKWEYRARVKRLKRVDTDPSQ